MVVLFRFDVNQPCFFTPAIRSRIVQFILDRKRFTTAHDDDYAFGIDRLIGEGVYIAAYPLHDVSFVKNVIPEHKTHKLLSSAMATQTGIHLVSALNDGVNCSGRLYDFWSTDIDCGLVQSSIELESRYWFPNDFLCSFSREKSLYQAVCVIYSIQNGLVYRNGIATSRWIMLRSILVLKLVYISLGWDSTRICCCWLRSLVFVVSCTPFSPLSTIFQGKLFVPGLFNNFIMFIQF